jgi:hypothetical protein
MTLSVELTGIHVDRWHVETEGYPLKDRSWVSGLGAQTLGFSTPRPLRFQAMAIAGETPSGERLPPLTLAPLGAPKPLEGSLRRRGSWHYNDPQICDREGGCEEANMLVPSHVPPICPARRIGVPAAVEVERLAGSGASALAVSFEPLPIEGAWENCPPDMDGARRPLALAQPAKVRFGGALAKISRLGVGDEATLKAHLVQGAADGSPAGGRCPHLEGPEQQECAVTDLTLEVSRLR